MEISIIQIRLIWKIQELYINLIYNGVLNRIAEEDGTEDELIERLNNLT
jgi:hypothetical protein